MKDDYCYEKKSDANDSKGMIQVLFDIHCIPNINGFK